MITLNRIKPQAGPEFFKTYQLLAPITSHRRRATCTEAGCIKRQRGFKAQFDASTPAGKRHCAQVERSSRSYAREVTGALVTYVFPAGQDCFDRHTVTLEREPLYVVRGGDHRGDPRRAPTVTHARPEHWVEDFAEHQDTIIRAQQRG